MFYVPKKHQVDADFAWIKVQIRLLLTKFYNFNYIQVEISRFWDKYVHVSSPGKKSPSPGIGTRPGGWVTLL